MSKEAGDSLLGSVAAMVSGSSATAGSTASAEQQASTTVPASKTWENESASGVRALCQDRLIGLTSKLGQSVMNSIEVNATQVLTSIGADGTGSQVVVKKQATEDVQRKPSYIGSIFSLCVPVPLYCTVPPKHVTKLKEWCQRTQRVYSCVGFGRSSSFASHSDLSRSCMSAGYPW